MGYSTWSDEAYSAVTSARAAAPARELFRGESGIDPLMNPRGIRAREARDSEHHPDSVPILVSFDVTGSMGDIPQRFATATLGPLMRRLVEGGWVKDPQVCFAAVGDAESDQAPLQVGQFESGLEMDMWLTRLWLEGRGGDEPESYLLPHWLAAHHTSTDAWEKRARRGFLFSIGDAHNKPITARHVQDVFGYEPEGPVDDATVVRAAAERYRLFHVLVTRGNPVNQDLVRHWRDLLGDGVLVLDHTDAICELMGVAMALCERRLDRAQGLAVLTGAGMAAAAANAALDGIARVAEA